MKIAVMGSGGIGGYFGGLLGRSGQDVTFVARGAHLAALRTNGLGVESQSSGDFALPKVAATDQPASIGPVDLVVFATKAYDLESAARSVLPILRRDSLVLPLLNGVDIADRLAAVIGAERVMGGLCTVSSAIKAPGVIRQVGPLNKVVLGELKGGMSPRGQAIVDALKAAGIAAELSPGIQVELWKKYLFIDAAGGVCAVTRSTLGPVLKEPETRGLFVACMTEVETLARAKAVSLPATIVQDTLAFCDKLPEATKPSLLLSVEQGNPLEVDALSGTASRLGKELGVSTPVNDFITAALRLHAAGHKEPRP